MYPITERVLGGLSPWSWCGGSVGIAAGDFQGLWEGRERRLHRLSLPFHPTVSSTALLCLVPSLFVLNRADVVQRGVHALAVVSERPIQHCVLRRPGGWELFAVQPFHLQ